MKIKKALFTAIFSLLICLPVLCEDIRNIDFYGVVSTDADRNMINMTEDLFYTQLSEMDLNLNDMRSPEFIDNYLSDSPATFFESSDDSFSIYIVINKLPSMKWKCTISLRNNSSEKVQSSSQEYDSYYKILMQSKSSINSTISDLLKSKTQIPEQTAQPIPQITSISTEQIAGTWIGESFINKIVIMRGGRGFIIYKNGASMNISVSIKNEEKSAPVINIFQTSSNNASFYPEISRNFALECAASANPIEWNLQLISNNTLKGEKTTLIQNKPDSIPEPGSLSVEWTKIN